MVYLKNDYLFEKHFVKTSKNSYFSMNGSRYDGNSTFSNESDAGNLLFKNGELRWGLLAVSVIIICTTIGNLLVCLAVMWDRRLQNMTNYFLMSLAIADFLVSLLVMPFGMIVEMFGFFPLQAEFCVFWVTMDVLMCTASIWHMCTMSMDRYFTLKYPMRYGRNKTKMMVAMKIFFVWVVSITISSPICIFGIKDTNSVFNDGLCVPTIREFVIYGSVFAFYIPLTIMLITYVLTIRILWQNQLTMKKIERSDLRPISKSHTNGKYAVKTLLSPPSDQGSRRMSSGNDGSDTEASFVGVSTMNQDTNSPIHTRSPTRDFDNQPSKAESSTTLLSGNHNKSSAIRPNTLKTIQKPKSPSDFTSSPAKHRNDEVILEYTLDPTTDPTTESSYDPSNRHLYIPPSKITISKASLSSTQSPKESPKTLDQKAASMSCLQSQSSEYQNSSTTKLSQNHTDFVSQKTDNFLRVNSNHLLPVHREKQPLQAAVSFATVPQCRSNTQRLPRFHGTYSNSCSNIDSTDYKFSEWKQHYFQIQKEMDQILRDSESERRQKASPCSSPVKEENKVESNFQRSSSYSSSNYLCIDSPHSLPSDSAESLDDMDDTSSNNSDLITIKLQPTSLHMYRLNISHDSSSPLLRKPKNGHIGNGYCNGVNKGHKRSYGIISRSASERSIKSSNTPSRSSIHNLLKQFNKTQGKRHLLSKRATSNERKASKVLGIIFAVFVILWTPFFTVNIMSVTCPGCMENTTPILMSVFLWMGYVASLANPIIYTMFNTAFRRAFIKILKCHLCRNGSLHGESTIMSYAISNNIAACNDRRNTMIHLLKDDTR